MRPLRVAATAQERLRPHDAEHLHAERRLHHPPAQGGQRRPRSRSCRRPPAASRRARAAPRRSPRRSCSAPPACVRRRGSAPCRRGRESPRAAAARAARAARSDPPTPESNTPIGRAPRVARPGSLGMRRGRARPLRRRHSRDARSATVGGSCARSCVSNMRPDAAHPERGTFVRDQVAALRGCGDGDVEVELYEFPPGARSLRAARDLRRRYGALELSRRPGARRASTSCTRTSASPPGRRSRFPRACAR